MGKISFFILSLICAVVLIMPMMGDIRSIATAQEGESVLTHDKTVQSSSASLDAKVAPGEILPVSVKLSNFGGGKRVDVTIDYLIISDNGQQIYKSSETVAVETTNNFIKTIQIPKDAASGIYTSKTSITYQGQQAPAITQFSFRVERKILGLFQNDFILYGVGTILLSVLIIVTGYNLVEHRLASRFDPIDYSNIPHKDRVFYELISDTVLSMKQKVGEQALEIASQIEGLTINKKTGRVVKLGQSPSKIVADLVTGYEKSLNHKVSFSFREQKN